MFSKNSESVVNRLHAAADRASRWGTAETGMDYYLTSAENRRLGYRRLVTAAGAVATAAVFAVGVGVLAKMGIDQQKHELDQWEIPQPELTSDGQVIDPNEAARYTIVLDIPAGDANIAADAT